jgi:hypothetical protein
MGRENFIVKVDVTCKEKLKKFSGNKKRSDILRKIDIYKKYNI